MLTDINKFDLKRLIAFAALNAFGVLLIYFLHDFIKPFLGALIFYILFKNFMHKMVYEWKWKQSIAALVIILLSFFIILIPVLTLSYLLYSKLSLVLNDPASLITVLDLFDKKVLEYTGIEIFDDANIHELKTTAANLIPTFLSELAYTLGNIGIMYFILYYLLKNSSGISREVNNYLPFEHENIDEMAKELESQTLSNAVGVPLVGTIQGVAAGIGYWIFGLNEPVFWAAITAFTSLLPFIGTALIWVPASIFIMASGNLWAGLGLFTYGTLVIMNIDNVARFMIQKKFADVHPMITVFGVLIGLELFGLAGIIFGPLMLSYFILFVKMYRRVYDVKPK